MFTLFMSNLLAAFRDDAINCKHFWASYNCEIKVNHNILRFTQNGILVENSFHCSNVACNYIEKQQQQQIVKKGVQRVDRALEIPTHTHTHTLHF